MSLKSPLTLHETGEPLKLVFPLVSRPSRNHTSSVPGRFHYVVSRSHTHAIGACVGVAPLGVKYLEVGWKWKVDGSGSAMEVEGRWKWKRDGSGRSMEVEALVTAPNGPNEPP